MWQFYNANLLLTRLFLKTVWSFNCRYFFKIHGFYCSMDFQKFKLHFSWHIFFHLRLILLTFLETWEWIFGPNQFSHLDIYWTRTDKTHFLWTPSLKKIRLMIKGILWLIDWLIGSSSSSCWMYMCGQTCWRHSTLSFSFGSSCRTSRIP